MKKETVGLVIFGAAVYLGLGWLFRTPPDGWTLKREKVEDTES